MTFPPGPYSLGGSEPVIIDGVERAPGLVMRDNDGTLAIMAPSDPHETGSDRQRIGGVHPVSFDPKRGQGHRMTFEDDPVQHAVARLWMASPDLLEAAEVYLTARDEFREFERDHPNDATHRWDDKLMAIEVAENALRAAVAKARGPG